MSKESLYPYPTSKFQRAENGFEEPRVTRDSLTRCLKEDPLNQLNDPQKKLLEIVRAMGDEGFPRDYISSTLRDLKLSLDDYRRMFDIGCIEFDSVNKTIKYKNSK